MKQGTRFTRGTQLVCSNAACKRSFTAKHHAPGASSNFCSNLCRLDAFKRSSRFGQGETVFRRRPTGTRRWT